MECDQQQHSTTCCLVPGAALAAGAGSLFCAVANPYWCAQRWLREAPRVSAVSLSRARACRSPLQYGVSTVTGTCMSVWRDDVYEM